MVTMDEAGVGVDAGSVMDQYCHNTHVSPDIPGIPDIHAGVRPVGVTDGTDPMRTGADQSAT
jgi:hypothetical protein